MSEQPNGAAYWQACLKLLTTVLVIWFLVSYGAGILFVEALNGIMIAGYPLGFWFAQQGAIVAFLILVFWYSKKMEQIDKDHDVHED